MLLTPCQLQQEAGPLFWQLLNMNTAQTIYLCFNVEYSHGSSFPFASGSVSSVSCWGSEPLKLNWFLTEKPIYQRVEVFARSGKKQCKHCPIKSDYTQIHTQSHAAFKGSFHTNQSILPHSIFFSLKKRSNIHLTDTHPSQDTRAIQKYEQIAFNCVF